MQYRTSQHTHRSQGGASGRLRLLAVAITMLGAVVIIRLFLLMVIQNGFYTALAVGSQETYSQLFPKRGKIFIQDTRSREFSPLVINRDTFLVYADTRQITSDEMAATVADTLAEMFQYETEKKDAIAAVLNKRTDPYEPIEPKISEEQMEELQKKALPGIGFVRHAERYYAEGKLAAHIVGFMGKDESGQSLGRYGLEGYWQQELAGSGGFMEGAQSAKGRWLPFSDTIFQEAVDGADFYLTLDRTLQYKACERLRQAREEYGATSATLIMMEPDTGAIRVMCSMPDFDPNTYNEVPAIDVYNNTAIFTPYEPGSIMKPLTMAAALAEGAVTPNTPFFDSGAKDGLCSKPIKNAGERSYGDQTMVGVLKNSINTGIVYVAERLGKKKFREYMEQFGFGVQLGIELDTEVTGTIEALEKNNDSKVDCYTATAAFGQGVTVTPLQILNAFAAVANGGVLMKPYIIDEIRYPDGRNERTKPQEIRRVVDNRVASLVRGMMVSVVDDGQAKAARVPGYYVGGKTGTAQIFSGQGGYSEETNHSFVGFAPVDHPRFVMLVKFEKPNQKYADSTAAPVFADVAKFVLQYYDIAPTR